MRYLFFVLLTLGFLTGCNKEEKRAEADDLTIQEYIKDNGLDAFATGSGLYVVIDNPGTGTACGPSSTVEVNYSGYYTNHMVFDAHDGAVLSLQSVIEGWQEGIPHFREGGSGKLLIPSALAYGNKGNSTIPPNTVLIFDIELVDVL